MKPILKILFLSLFIGIDVCSDTQHEPCHSVYKLNTGSLENPFRYLCVLSLYKVLLRSPLTNMRLGFLLIYSMTSYCIVQASL